MTIDASKKKIFVVFIIAVATVLLSILPEARVEHLTHTSYNYYFDLFQHSFYYFMLTFASCWIFSSVQPWKIAIVLFFISLGLEIVQQFIPRRSFSVHDIFSNLTGITLALVIVTLFRHYRKKSYAVR